MASPRHLYWIAALLAFCVPASSAVERSPSPETAEKADLDVNETDYTRQFGIVRQPYYGQPDYGYHNHHTWYPSHPNYPDHTRVPIDPYVLQLVTRYARFLPQGLGPYGIYGSTGLPKLKPPGVFRYPESK